ncbi:hypothetical protein [Sulfuriferula thiophila]|uniref:hypothetical protein n=1 Tax=Sulfuriferula thiophila TaxID=1781211 RepID=UPI000F60CB2B|nr:hypothetical protein [Sulfuriferula thiophila]
MNSLLLFSAEILLSLSLSATVLYAISSALRNALQDLCPSDRQAEFWVAYTRTMLILAPLLLVMVVDGMSSHGDVLGNIRIALVAALAGLLFGMIIVGKKVFIPVSQQIAQPAETGELS